MLSRRQVSLGLLAAAVSTRARAQPYPTRPVRLIVPYAAGGGTDAIAHLLADSLGARLGQSVTVDNDGADGGNAATAQAAAAAPDGYTVLMANQGPMVVNPHISRGLKVDPLTAFDPVTLIADAPLVIVVAPDSRFATFKDLVSFAAANPGKLTYGSAGNGSASHMATVLLAHQANLRLTHAPYDGAGPALGELLAGRMDFMVTTLPSVMELLQGDRVRALAVTSAARSKALPDVPTVAESGLPAYRAGAWYGFVVPRGTPARAVMALRDATLAAINRPSVRARLEREGAQPIGSTPREFAEMMREESARWKDVVKDAGVTVE